MTTAFARHHELVPDDSMEVSLSPAGNHYDDEVLIDYDDYGTAALTEDEQMIEDGEPTRPGTATDDMMEDAEPVAPVNEEIMHDDPVAVAPEPYVEDEELIDYSDEDYQDDTQVTLDDTAVEGVEVVESSTLAPAETVNEPETVDDAIVQQLENAAAGEESTEQFLSAVEIDLAPSAGADDEAPATAAVLDDDETAHAEQDQHGAADETSRRVDAEEAAAQELGVQAFEADEPDAQPTDLAGEQHHETEGLERPPTLPAGLDTRVYFAPDGPQTPSDTGIHPITVRYGDIVMPLFKSSLQPGGLLKNDNLASVSLGDLLENCRHRLAVKIGESVSADQELVLNFENMGLQLVEHSSHAFGTSLQDVLGVYLNLHENDSTHPIPPLALSLSSQLKFTSSFNILKAAAEQGEGMSKFAFLSRSGAEELEEYEEGDEEDARHEQYEDHEDVGEEPHYESEGNLAEDHSDGEASHRDEGQEYEEDQETGYQEGFQGIDAGQSIEGHADDNNLEEYDEQHPTDPAAELDHDGNNGEAPEEGAGSTEGSQHGSPRDKPEDQNNNAQESEESVRPESPASSTNVRGDSTKVVTGEYYYNEDFIDFGDDDLTADTAELHVDDGYDDFSAQNGEHDAGEAVHDATSFDDDQQPVATDAANEVSALNSPSNQSSTDVHAGEVPKADDAANETRDETNNSADQHGQDEGPPADNLDLNEDDLPVEDDEQLDPAFDLLEGHDFEDFAENVEPSKSADGLEFDDDDDIGFNDDVEEAVLASNSPLGKRSFDEHVGKDDVAEKPELKRARS